MRRRNNAPSGLRRDSEEDNPRSGHLGEGQSWPERHGIEQQTPAPWFARQTSFVCETGTFEAAATT
jgi:hypothetical protein